MKIGVRLSDDLHSRLREYCGLNHISMKKFASDSLRSFPINSTVRTKKQIQIDSQNDKSLVNAVQFQFDIDEVTHNKLVKIYVKNKSSISEVVKCAITKALPKA